jgi:hypothetical protein
MQDAFGDHDQAGDTAALAAPEVLTQGINLPLRLGKPAKSRQVLGPQRPTLRPSVGVAIRSYRFFNPSQILTHGPLLPPPRVMILSAHVDAEAP